MSADEKYTYDGKWGDRPIQEATKRKMEKAAVAYAAILNGTYDWNGRTVPKHEDGTIRVPCKELRIAGGWAVGNDKANENFSHQYFRDCVKREMQRVEGGIHAELARIESEGVTLNTLLDLLKAAMLEDLKDPAVVSKLSLKEKADIFGKLAAKVAAENGDFGTRHSQVAGGDLMRQIADKANKQGAAVEFNQMKVKVEGDAQKAELAS